MKNPGFIFLFLFIGLQLSAQQSTVIHDTTYFRRLYNAGSLRTMTKDSVIAAPVKEMPKSFADTLRKYDWLLLQNVDRSGHMNNFFGFQPCVRCYYNVMRIDTGVTNHLLTLQPDYTLLHDVQLSEGHFNGTTTRNDTNLLLMQVYRKNTWSGMDYRQFEMKRIVSYTNGVLIVDQLDYTQAWHPIIFRSVYLRIDRIP
jgi:hypothetical protein